MEYIVTLELPECSGETPTDAVRDFQMQAAQFDLWSYRVTEAGGERRTFVVDTAEPEDSPNHIRELST
jgi:hypothetical protein